MGLRILGIVGALLIVDGLVLSFFPKRVERILGRLFGDGASQLVENRAVRILATVEIIGGGALLALALIWKSYGS
jgi:hypothetical protein